jgi:small-conductance mechanosensitive channel
MAIFESDVEAIVYLGGLLLLLLIVNGIISYVLKKIKRVKIQQRVMATFLIRIISVIVFIYFVVEGIPFIETIDAEYFTILTTSISTALAFASKGIFSNLVSGIVLLIVSPFDIGDVVKIEGELGVIRNIELLKTTVETFDNIIIKKSNSEILSSKITNYSVEVENVEQFKTVDKNAQQKKKEKVATKKKHSFFNHSLKDAYSTIKSKVKLEKIHNFVFVMDFPYKRFDEILEKIDNVIEEYQPIFGVKPTYQIYEFGLRINVRFRIITDDTENLFEYQPEFAEDIAKIIK